MSTDGGSVWSLLDSYYGDGGALIQDPNSPLVYYTGGTVISGSYSVMCVSKSTDGGLTWPARYNLTAAAGYCYALAVDPGNTNIVYAGGAGGLFKSTNAGASWGSSSTGITGDVYDIKLNPQNTNIVYAGTPDGVFRSANAGGTWTDTGCDSVVALLVNPAHPDTVYAGTGYGVFLSTVGGGSWTAMNAGLANLKVKSLALNPNNYLLCGTSEGAYRWSLAVDVEEGTAVNKPGIGISICPNPFRTVTNISIGHRVPLRGSGASFQDFQTKSIELKIYDATGRLVNSFVFPSSLSPNPSPLTWSGTDHAGHPLPAGVYFVTVKAGTVTETKTLLLVH
jgi:photosystem II stability/assembly factor-like uncharacterized protein